MLQKKLTDDYTCRTVGCVNPATDEFYYMDEERMLFITWRCELHPEEDPQYNHRSL